MTAAEMVKQLGDVRLTFNQGQFEARSNGIVHYGDTPEGAMLNVVNAKNQAPAAATHQGFVPRPAVVKQPGRAYSSDDEELPSAGQDYF